MALPPPTAQRNLDRAKISVFLMIATNCTASDKKILFRPKTFVTKLVVSIIFCQKSLHLLPNHWTVTESEREKEGERETLCERVREILRGRDT